MEKLLVPPRGPLMWSSLLLPTNSKVTCVLFFYSAPHQLQTNGLNLIRLFNPMALKFDTSSNYKKTISPPKIFQTLRLLVSPPLEQKSKFSLSLSLSHIEAFSLHGTATGPNLRFRWCWPFSHWKIPKIPAGTVTNFKIFLYSTKPCYTWDISVDSPWPWLQLEASKAHTTTTGGACWPDLLLSLGLCFFALSSPAVAKLLLAPRHHHFWWCFSPYIPQFV